MQHRDPMKHVEDYCTCRGYADYQVIGIVRHFNRISDCGRSEIRTLSSQRYKYTLEVGTVIFCPL